MKRYREYKVKEYPETSKSEKKRIYSKVNIIDL
jgi:hypothetical protein